MPETAVAPCFKVNVAVVIVNGSIASLKVALIFVLMSNTGGSISRDCEKSRWVRWCPGPHRW